MSNLAVTPLEELVAKATRGDHDAFAGLVDRTRNLVCSIAMAVLRDVDASQEVAQDVYLAVWRDLRRLRSVGSFLPWLRQITRNRAHHVLRSRVRHRRVFSDHDPEVLIESIAVPGSPGDRLLEDEQRRRLTQAIDDLPDESREVVALYYREEQSVQQVAMLLGLSADAVKQRLLRARTKLRAAMLDDLGATLRDTAPGAAFTAGVMILTMAAPATAATASAVATSAPKVAGLGGLSQLLVALTYGLPGLLGGHVGLKLAHRQWERTPFDEEERLELSRLRHTALAAIVVFCVAVPVGYRTLRTPLVLVLCYVAFMSVLGELYLRRLPRILERRLAAERHADPKAILRQARERRMRYVGFVLGAIGGAVGVAAGIMASRGG